MYKGPYYFHQPAHAQFLRTAILLNEGIGDGVIVAAKTALKTSTKKFPDYISAYQASGKQLLIDTEKYNPSEIRPEGNELGSRILLDSNICTNYIADSLSFQHENNCTTYIIPNIETPSVSPAWYDIIRLLSTTGREWIAKNGDCERSVLLTISIPADYIADAENRLTLLNRLAWLRKFVDGYYLNLVNIPELLIDPKLIYGLFDLVFRLKLQDLQIAFSRAGAWIPTLFPFGLDVFANGSHKSGQKVRSRRNGSKRGGGGHIPYVNIWSPITMSYIKYPEEADHLHKVFSETKRKRLYGDSTGYAPPIDRTPESVYHSKGYKQPRRLNHFSASQANLAKQYREQSFHQRISAVQNQLTEAYETERQIGSFLGDPERGREKLVWLETFNRFVDEKQYSLEELFD